MSRPLFILIAVLIGLIVAAIALASVDTEVAPTTVRKPALTEAAPAAPVK